VCKCTLSFLLGHPKPDNFKNHFSFGSEMVTLLNPLEIEERSIIEELFAKADLTRCCPNIRRDSEGPYCAIQLKEGEPISEERRMVCDVASLQLWCLDPDRYNRCVVYD
jgi:hypothetical protein